MTWGPGEKRVMRVLQDLTPTLGSTRVFLHVEKYLGFGEIAWWKQQESFRGIPGRQTKNPMCHDTLSLNGAELRALWWAQDKLPEKIQPGRAEGSPRHTDQDRKTKLRDDSISLLPTV